MVFGSAYERWYCGSKQFDGASRKRIIAHNVIVQYCPLSYIDNVMSRPVLTLTGEGRMDAYIDGCRTEGFWRRDGEEGQTQFFDADGNALKLRPGKTFIQVIPEEYGFAYDGRSGIFHCSYAPGGLSGPRAGD